MFDSIKSRRIIKSAAFSFNGSIVFWVENRKEAIWIRINVTNIILLAIHEFLINTGNIEKTATIAYQNILCVWFSCTLYTTWGMCSFVWCAYKIHFHLPNSSNNLLTVIFPSFFFFFSLPLFNFCFDLEVGNNKVTDAIHLINGLNTYWNSQYVRFKTLHWTQ